MKLLASLVFFFGLSTVFAQQVELPPQTDTPVDTSTNPITLVTPFEGGRNFFNYYAFLNGVFERGTSGINTTGVELGGGVSAFRQWASANLALSYRGGYRAYTGSYSSGTDQDLSLLYFKRLGRRWTLTLGENAGILLYGGVYYGQNPTLTNTIQTNPFANETKFAASSVVLTYQQSRRLSYAVTGAWYLSRYNVSQLPGSTSLDATGSIFYRITRRTTISGTYGRSYYQFQRGIGTSDIDSIYLTVSHQFGNRWNVGVSGGISRADSSGIAAFPFQLFPGLAPIYIVGAYHTKSTLPYFQAFASRNWRRSSITFGGGESITPGNGFVLTSRNIGLNGLYSYNLGRSNVSAGGYYSRLSSLSNAVATTAISSALDVSWASNIFRHIGVNARYDYIHYGALGSYGGTNDNRLSFGLYYSSRSIPIGLF
ncbi:MAG: hypothetical protein JOZ62_15035 [Acidobacteriaceae bacterium]|nr:hypothetical protein [Acidobacteriaceae bacterium]